MAAVAPTPFYDHLMSMVQATAQENVHVAQGPDGGQLAASRKSQITTILHLVAGVIVAVAVGRAVFVWVTKPTEPLAVASTVEPARSEERVPAVEPTAEPIVVAQPAAPIPLATVEPDQPTPTAGDAPQTAAVAPDPVTRASLVGPPAVTPPAELPPTSAQTSPPAGVPGLQEPAARAVAAAPAAQDPEPAAEPEPTTVAAVEPTSVAAVEPATDAPVAAADAPSRDAAAATEPAPQPAQRAIQTGSIGRADAAAELPVATRTAWIVSDVRLRAGPGNSEAVLGTIGKGRPVEVVSCKAWCEVIFAGQRGWVYKGFIGEVPAAAQP